MPEQILRWPGLGAPHGFETRDGTIAADLPAPIHRVRQVHGNIVHVLGPQSDHSAHAAAAIDDRPAGDALVTNVSGVALGVATADCVPVLLHDPAAGVVAAVHAGWRGVASRIVPETLRIMAAEFGCRAADCRAAIGPCVGAAVYRVGPDVCDGFAAAGIPDHVFSAPRVDADGRETRLCDLTAATRWQLEHGGLDSGAIWAAERCTAAENEVFHSYRRDGEAAGRMTAAIALV